MLRSGISIAYTYSVIIDKDTGTRTETPKHYEAISKSLGRCGHQHKTKKAAEPCYKRLMHLAFERRKQNSLTQQAERRRNVILARDYELAVAF